MKKLNPVPSIFLLLFLVSWYYSGMSFTFVGNEVITRFIRDGVLVLALLIPILAGMGINFAVTIGAISAQIGLLIIIMWQIEGITGIILAGGLSLGIAFVMGWIIGIVLNRVKGKEMITTIIIGFLGNGIYQFIFLVGYGTFIKAINTEIMLSRGVGVRNMVDLAAYRNILDNIWVIHLGGISIPLFMIMVVLSFCLVVTYIINTRMGQKFKAVGEDMDKSAAIGIDVDRTRIQAMIISTIIACIGQLIYLQNIGMLNVYTAHLNSDIFSAAALLAGGASVKSARVRHAILGVFLFHSLFIVSPQAGQNLFGNAALGEYFRSFIAYGTIAIALIFNVRDKAPD
ncbi:abc transporter integral membrane protein [hydrocarbon metagenome]|uniref:Abc transporter integral membrane protein n=1 Tax=hydrocarbon metagenome TaxID=938273 RepID=A0A0W8E919_9ZZZZ